MLIFVQIVAPAFLAFKFVCCVCVSVNDWKVSSFFFSKLIAALRCQLEGAVPGAQFDVVDKVECDFLRFNFVLLLDLFYIFFFSRLLFEILIWSNFRSQMENSVFIRRVFFFNQFDSSPGNKHIEFSICSSTFLCSNWETTQQLDDAISISRLQSYARERAKQIPIKLNFPCERAKWPLRPKRLCETQFSVNTDEMIFLIHR